MFSLLDREKTFHEILLSLASQIDNNVTSNRVNVDRDDVLDGGLRAFVRSTFNPRSKLFVRFIGENGMDNGGLSREFLRLAIKKIQELSLFSGEDNARMLSLDYGG